MNPAEFVSAIYLGDSGINNIFLDISNKVVKLQFDAIALKNAIDNTESDFLNAKIVFTEVDFFSLTPPGFFPSEFVDIEEFYGKEDGKYYMILFSGCYAENTAENQRLATKDIAGNIISVANKVHIDIRIKIVFTGINLEK